MKPIQQSKTCNAHKKTSAKSVLSTRAHSSRNHLLDYGDEVYIEVSVQIFAPFIIFPKLAIAAIVVDLRNAIMNAHIID